MSPKPDLLDDIKVYRSQIAPISQGEYKAIGGGEQILVPNRSQWFQPEKIGEIGGERFR